MDNTQRFSHRVDDYQRYRPGYPDELIETLRHYCALKPGDPVADVGAGTGIFTQKLIEVGLQVYAIEPNTAMRNMAEQQLGKAPNFTSLDGSAESSGLDSSSVRLITVAQAFHWFNNTPAHMEFTRVLQADGYLALIWNRRRMQQAFQQAYESLLQRNAPDYGKVNHMDIGDDQISDFFGHRQVNKLCFDYRQQLDFDGLLGRVKSSSYCPQESSPEFAQLRNELEKLFHQHATNGRIDFDYDTELFIGRMHGNK